MKCVFYGRYSTDMQRETSIDDQYRNCQRYADKEGWTITQRYEDKGISGTDKTRPQYQKLLQDATDYKFNVVLTDDLSRLGRDSVETEMAIRKLEFANIRLIAVSDGYDSQLKSRKVHRGMKNMMNELYIDDLAEKIKRGMAGQVERGFTVGGRVFGYRSKPIYHPTEKDNYGRPVIESVKRVIDPDQAEVVKRIFQLFVDGYSPRAIGIKLDQEGIKPPRAKHWHQNSIDKILKNEIYTGKVVWNTSHWPKCPTTGKRKRVAKPETEWITRQDNKLRIITDAVWQRAKARQAEQAEKGKAIKQALHKNARTGASPKYLFSGLLRCSECGGRYVVVSKTSYGCATRQRHGDSACSNKLRVDRALVERKLLESIKSDLFRPEAMEFFKRKTTEYLTEVKRKKAPDHDKDRKRLATVEKEIESMVSAIKAGTFSDTLKASLESAETEKADLLSKLNVDTKQLDKIFNFLPTAVESFELHISNLDKSLQFDIAKSRTKIKTMLGDDIKLYPKGDYLEAELAPDYGGLMTLASKGKISNKSVEGFEAFGAYEAFEAKEASVESNFTRFGTVIVWLLLCLAISTTILLV